MGPTTKDERAARHFTPSDRFSGLFWARGLS